MTTYTYTADDQLATMVFTNAPIATPSVSYTYDPAYPRVATMVDGIGTTSYTYHAAGQLGAGQVASVDGPLTDDTITYAYDEIGRVTTRAINGAANTVTWAFDALGRVTTETNMLGSFTYTYDSVSGRIASVAYPNNQTSTYTYLPASQDLRLQTIHHKYPNSATLSKFDYTYDAVGNILTWRQQADSTAVLWHYAYDAADQLIGARKESTDPTPLTLQRFAYAYDPAGNRTVEQIDDVITFTTHDALNRLVTQAPGGPVVVAGSVNEPATVTINGQPVTLDALNQFRGTASAAAGTSTFTIAATDPSNNTATAQWEIDQTGASKTFTYDANGNLTSDASRTMAWDARNQVVSVTAGINSREFAYDGFRRAIQSIKKASGVVQSEAVALWCDSDICEERAPNGTTVERRAFARAEEISANGQFLTTDHLGSSDAVTDNQASILARYQYDPWGRRTLSSGTDETSIGFAGRRYLSDTGNLTLFRIYDAEIGRWWSEDPILRLIEDLSAQSGGAFPRPKGAIYQQYFYAGNTPLTLTDDLGARPQPPSSGRDCSSRSPLCETYAPCDNYVGANARCFCRCGGNGAWANYVRCCLVDARRAGYSMEDAHLLCYALGMLKHPTSVSPTGLAVCYRNCFAAQAMCGCSK